MEIDQCINQLMTLQWHIIWYPHCSSYKLIIKLKTLGSSDHDEAMEKAPLLY